MWANIVAVTGIIGLCGFIGLLMHARFFDCDPISAKVSYCFYRNKSNNYSWRDLFGRQMIKKADEIVPYYVMETVGSWSGLPGLFVAGIFSGALRFAIGIFFSHTNQMPIS